MNPVVTNRRNAGNLLRNCGKFEFFLNIKILYYSIVRNFVTPPPPHFRLKTLENPRKVRKSLVNSDFKQEKSGKKKNHVCLKSIQYFKNSNFRLLGTTYESAVKENH